MQPPSADVERAVGAIAVVARETTPGGAFALTFPHRPSGIAPVAPLRGARAGGPEAAGHTSRLPTARHLILRSAVREHTSMTCFRITSKTGGARAARFASHIHRESE